VSVANVACSVLRLIDSRALRLFVTKRGSVALELL
jgi:hypothetical protein